MSDTMTCQICGFKGEHYPNQYHFKLEQPWECLRHMREQVEGLKRKVSHLEMMIGIQVAEQAPVCVECRSRSAAWGAGTMCYDCQANRYYNPQPSV
jgi:hypothetical protein